MKITANQKLVDEGVLPPLPEPKLDCVNRSSVQTGGGNYGTTTRIGVYTAEEMLAYGRSCMEAVRK